MKYYVIEIATGDSKIAGKGVYEYDTEREAVANFHSKLGVAMKSELYETELVTVLNECGNQLHNEYFERNPVGAE